MKPCEPAWGSRASGLDDSGEPAFRTTRARPTAAEPERPTGSRGLCQSSPIADARPRFHRLRRQLPDERIGIQDVEVQHPTRQGEMRRVGEKVRFTREIAARLQISKSTLYSYLRHRDVLIGVYREHDKRQSNRRNERA